MSDDGNFQLSGDGSESSATLPSLRVAVVSARDGLGKTTVAVNLSLALAQQCQGQVALVDFDEGDAAVIMNLKSDQGFAELRHYSTDDINMAMLSHYELPHPRGVTIYPAYARRDYSSERQNLLPLGQKVLETLSAVYSLVVCDVPALRSDSDLTLLSAFDNVLVITTAFTLLELRSTQLLLDRMGQLPENSRLNVVRNCRESRPLLRDGDVEQQLGHPLFATIAYDRASALDAINMGSPVVLSHPRSALSDDIRRLARQLLGVERDGAAARRGGLFRISA